MMLEFKQVNTFYGRVQALHDVSLSVRKGEIVTLIGANGAGKSTLLMTLCGDPRATSGSILYEARNWLASLRQKLSAKALPLRPKAGAYLPALRWKKTWPWAHFLATKTSGHSAWSMCLNSFPA